MRRALLTTTICFFFLSLFALNKIDINNKIDQIITSSMLENGIPGFSLAVIKDGEVIYNESHGKANVEHDVPLSDASIFRVYSITKLFVSTAVFKLKEEGKLSLEDMIGKFNLDVPESWSTIQIKNLLSHSSGLPDMAPIPDYRDLTETEAWQKVNKMPLLSKPGLQYNYNQTNFYLLQKIVEEVSGQTLRDFIGDHQFSGGNNNAFFSTDSRKIVRNRVTPYFPFETGEIMIDHAYLQGDFFEACNGVNITIEEFIKWDRQFTENAFLNAVTKDEMLSLFNYLDSDKKFTFGWDKRVLNGHESYGFSGSLVTAYRIFPKDGMSIILLGNGMAEFFDIENIVNEIAHVVVPDIIDQEKVLKDLLMQYIESGDIASYKERFEQSTTNPCYNDVGIESIGNSIGYHLLRRSRLQEAIDVFFLNTKLFPESWNVFDSLGEAYMIVGNKEKAIINYEQSILLNPGNEFGKEALKKLNSK